MNSSSIPQVSSKQRAGSVTTREIYRRLGGDHSAVKKRILKHLGISSVTEQPGVDAGLTLEMFRFKGELYEQYRMSYHDAGKLLTEIYGAKAVHALAFQMAKELQGLDEQYDVRLPVLKRRYVAI